MLFPEICCQYLTMLTKCHQNYTNPLNMRMLLFSSAVGGALAKKISNQITTQTNKLKQSIQDYNHLYERVATQLPKHVVLKEAYDVKSQLWQCLDSTKLPTGNGVIPVYVKRQLIDLLHRVTRSAEEVNLLQGEMGNCIKFYQAQITSLQMFTSSLHPQDPYERGIKCLVECKLKQVKAKNEHLKTLFKKCGVVIDDGDVSNVNVANLETDGEAEGIEGETEDVERVGGEVVEAEGIEGEVERIERETEEVERMEGETVAEGMEGETEVAEGRAVETEVAEGMEGETEVAEGMEGETDEIQDNEEEQDDLDNSTEELSDYDPLDELYALVTTYEEPVTSDESDAEASSEDS